MRKCVRCHVGKTPERFPERGVPRFKGAPPPKLARRSSVCWACLETEAIELEAKKAMRRATWTDPKTGEVVRRCMTCGVVKRLYSDYYLKHKPHPNSTHPPSGPCKVCHDKRTAHYRSLNRDRTRVRWAAAGRRRNAAIKADPTRKAKLREDERLKRRMQAEAEGRTMRQVRPRVTQPTGPSRLPSAPLAALVTRTIERREAVLGLIGDGDHATTEAVCADLRVSSRTFRRWRSGEQPEVNIGKAEAVLMVAGVEWHEVYSYDDYAAHFLAIEVGS